MDASVGLSLTFSPEKNVVAFMPNFDSRFWIIGASVPWVGKKESWTDSASFVVDPKDKKGVIAIATAVKVSRGKFSDSHVQAFLLPISWQKEGQDDKSNPVDLSRAWVPPEDRMLWVEHNAERYSTKIVLKLRTKKKIFAASPDIPGTFYVPDADLLCRFAAGTADIIEVLHNATETKKELTAQKKFVELQKSVQSIINELRETTHSLEFWKDRAFILKMAICWWLVDGTEGRWPFTWFRRWLTPYAVSQASESRFWLNKKDE